MAEFYTVSHDNSWRHRNPENNVYCNLLTADAVYTYKVTKKAAISLRQHSIKLNVSAEANLNLPAAPKKSVNTNVTFTVKLLKIS